MLISVVYIILGVVVFRRLFLSGINFSVLPSHIIFFVFYLSGITNYLLCCVVSSYVGEYDSTFKRFGDVFLWNSLETTYFEVVHLMYLLTVIALSFFVISHKYNLKYSLLSIKILPVFQVKNNDLLVLMLAVLLLRGGGLSIDSSLNFFVDASNLILLLFLVVWTGGSRSHRGLLVRVALSFAVILFFHTVLPYIEYYLAGHSNVTIQRGSFVRYLVVYFLYVSVYMVLVRKVKLIKVIILLLIVFVSSVLLDLAQDVSASGRYSLFDLLLRFMFGFEHGYFRNVAIVLDALSNAVVDYYYGLTFLDALYGLIPFTGENRGLSLYIHLLHEDLAGAEMNSMYASGILVEGLLNFGIYIGPVVAAVIVFYFSLLYDRIFVVSDKSSIYLLASIYVNYMLYDLYRYDVAILLRKLEYGIIVVIIAFLCILIVKSGVRSCRI